MNFFLLEKKPKIKSSFDNIRHPPFGLIGRSEMFNFNSRSHVTWGRRKHSHKGKYKAFPLKVRCGPEGG